VKAMLGLKFKKLSLGFKLFLRETMLPFLFDPRHILLHFNSGLLEALSDFFNLLTLSFNLFPRFSLPLLHVSDLHLEVFLDFL
jgi:hypothetical protein